MFYVGSKVQEMCLVARVRMYSLDSELSVGKRSRLVEDDSLHLRKQVHIVGTLNENTLTRSTSDTPEERQRNADDKGTGTRDDKEKECSVQPL